MKVFNIYFSLTYCLLYYNYNCFSPKSKVLVVALDWIYIHSHRFFLCLLYVWLCLDGVCLWMGFWCVMWNNQDSWSWGHCKVHACTKTFFWGLLWNFFQIHLGNPKIGSRLIIFPQYFYSSVSSTWNTNIMIFTWINSLIYRYKTAIFL